MPTRNVLLTDHQEAFIGDLVRSGRYRNASEVLRESLRPMERRSLWSWPNSTTCVPDWTRRSATWQPAERWRSRPACWTRDLNQTRASCPRSILH